MHGAITLLCALCEDTSEESFTITFGRQELAASGEKAGSGIGSIKECEQETEGLEASTLMGSLTMSGFCFDDLILLRVEGFVPSARCRFLINVPFDGLMEGTLPKMP